MMYDIRPLMVEFHNAEDNDPEKSFIGFLLDLFRLGVPEACSNLLTSRAIHNFIFTGRRACALVCVLNSDLEGSKRKRGSDSSKFTRRGSKIENFHKGGEVKKPRVVKSEKRGLKPEKEEGSVIVCALPAIGAEDLDFVKRSAIMRRKRVAEKAVKPKVGGQLQRGIGGWCRGLVINEPVMNVGKGKVKVEVLSRDDDDDSDTDSSIQIVGEKHQSDATGPSCYVDVDPEEVNSENLISDADVMKANMCLLNCAMKMNIYAFLFAL